MLFRITPEGNMFEDNPQILSMREFKGISEQGMRYVAFYADWLSPYRNLTDKERKSRSLLSSGLDEAVGLDKYINSYYEIQGIKEHRLNLEAIDTASKTIRNKLMTSDDSDEIKKVTTALMELTKQRAAIIKMINEQMGIEDSELLNEDNGYSTIDDTIV